MTARRSDRRTDEGAAMVLAILFMLALSSIGAAVIVLARTETFASLNYRMMSQARYGAEAGVHKAANYFLNTYALPGSIVDPLASYDTTVSPVTYLGEPVVLSALDDVESTYPVEAVRDAFSAAGQGTLAAGGATVEYRAYATLLSMRTIVAYGTNITTVVQTWRLTARGTIAGLRTAEVEVSALLEQQIVAAHTYAAFATNPGCGALTFGGGVVTDSYDSSAMTMVNGTPATDANGGHVGTNGNLTEGGGSIVNGSLSTPRSGVGNCKNGAVTALTQNGNAQVTGGIIALPQAVTYVPPALPDPLPPTTNVTVGSNATCASTGLPNCSGTEEDLIITPTGSPISLGNLKVSSGSTLHLAAGTYNINSIALTGNASLIIDSGPVIMNVVGASQGTPVDFTGGSTSNLTYDPSMFQLTYAGTGNVKLTGGTASSAMVYAPYASVSFHGGADFYGSVLAASVTNSGGTKIHYDRRLGRTFYTTGPFMMSTFTWKKY